VSDSLKNPIAPAQRTMPISTLLSLLMVLIILGAGVLLTALTSDVKRVSEPGLILVEGRPFLPEQTSNWSGGPQSGLTESEREKLPKDTQGARRQYTHPDGYKLYCSVVLAGYDVTSIHRPELCLPGQGWQIERKRTVPILSERDFSVTRLDAAYSMPFTEGRGMSQRAIFVYWFIGKGRTTAHHWQRILWTMQDRWLHGTNHRWAYLLVHAPLVASSQLQNPSITEQQTMDKVTDFVRNISPLLMAH